VSFGTKPRAGKPAADAVSDPFQLKKGFLTRISLPKVPISIVDDDEAVRTATSALVRSLGYAAATFASAEDFLESDRVNDTSCLITDVQMSGLSGVELQSRLLTDGRLIPVTGVTAHPEESIRTQMLRAGAVGFLTETGSALNFLANVTAFW
jgi:FixJ family two-component response regulator